MLLIVGLLGIYPLIVLIVAITGPHGEYEQIDNMREHAGLEMMAKGGKLIHVRETRSFRDVE